MKCFLSLNYVFKFIVSSRQLFSRATGGQNEDSFRYNISFCSIHNRTINLSTITIYSNALLTIKQLLHLCIARDNCLLSVFFYHKDNLVYANLIIDCILVSLFVITCLELIYTCCTTVSTRCWVYSRTSSSQLKSSSLTTWLPFIPPSLRNSNRTMSWLHRKITWQNI